MNTKVWGHIVWYYNYTKRWLFKAPSAFNLIHFSAFGSWDSLSVKGTFKPSLLWNNDCINVKHAGTGAMIGLPSKIAISTFAGLKLRRILRHNYVVYITCIHDELAYNIEFCSKQNGAVEDFASFEEAEDEQIQNLFEETTYNHQAILNMSKDIEIIRQNSRVSRMASSIISHEEILAAEWKNKIDQVWEDIIDLVHGKLTPRLVPFDLISSGVQKMQKRLQEAGSPLRILFPSAGNF